MKCIQIWTDVLLTSICFLKFGGKSINLFFGLEWIVLESWFSTRLSWNEKCRGLVKRILNSQNFWPEVNRCRHVNALLIYFIFSISLFPVMASTLHAVNRSRTNWYFGMIIFEACWILIVHHFLCLGQPLNAFVKQSYGRRDFAKAVSRKTGKGEGDTRCRTGSGRGHSFFHSFIHSLFGKTG